MRLECIKLEKTDKDELKDELLKIFDKKATNLDLRFTAIIPIIEVSEYIASLEPKTLIIQEHIQDPDYLAEHRAYYSKFTTRVNRYCTRMHIFSESYDYDELDALNCIDYMASHNSSEAGNNSYLGFVTLRPIATSPIGATILRKPNFSTKAQFVITSDNFKVNLTGRVFEVDGTPFMQQDNAVGACAQAAIWMSLRTIRQAEGKSPYTPAQITDAATRNIINGRTLPNRTGLTIIQMNEAIRSTGYVPHTTPLTQNNSLDRPEESHLDEIKKLVYCYVESGIPVILILNNNGSYHAVTAIGHGWEDDPERKISIGPVNVGQQTINVYDAASWIEPIIIHNDNTGPYQTLSKEPQVEDEYVLSQVECAIPIIHDTDFIDGTSARQQSLDLFAYWIKQVGTNDEDVLLNYEDLVFRTYMKKRSEFRKEVIASKMSENLKRYYREKWLPDRFWVTEINMFDNYENSPAGEGLRLGIILIDAASESVEYGVSLHSIYFDKKLIKDAQFGIIIDQDMKKGTIEAFSVEESIDDEPLNRVC